MSEGCDILPDKDWLIDWSLGYFDAVQKVRFTRSAGEVEAYDIEWTAGGATYKLADVACAQGMLSDRCEAFKGSNEGGWASIGFYDVYVLIDAAILRIEGLCELVTASGTSLRSHVGTEDPLAGSWGAESHGTGSGTGGNGRPEPPRPEPPGHHGRGDHP